MLIHRGVRLRRFILWGLVATYTAILPDVIIVYDAIAQRFSSQVTGKVPVAIVGLLAAGYVAYGLSTQENLRFLVHLLPCLVITYAIIALQANPNKHIHIPEYVLMAWILFEALSVDYNGRGIFILLFVCSTMVGVVDELAQGIHSSRHYGFADMVINSASTIIGVITLMGVRRRPAGDWLWMNSLKKIKTALAFVLFGAVGGVATCFYLFHVQENRLFWGVYPMWLLYWNGLFAAFTPAMVFSCRSNLRERHRGHNNRQESDPYAREITAHVWVFSLLMILFIVHTLVVCIGLFGWEFR